MQNGTRLSTGFGRVSHLESDRPLDDNQIARVAPSIFATEAHNSRSQRYTYIPTSEVLSGLRREGFQPFFVAQSRTRVEGKADFTKHILRLRREGTVTRQGSPEVILINSHDGTSSFQLIAGFIRFVCLNRMVCGDVAHDVKVHHKGNIVDNVIEGAYEIASSFEAVEEQRVAMIETRLDRDEQALFAEAAIDLRYDDHRPVEPVALLTARRPEDRGQNSVWGTFNRVQENLTRGGLRGVGSTGRRTRTRPISDISGDVKLNRALWRLADGMRRLKAGESVPEIEAVAETV